MKVKPLVQRAAFIGGLEEFRMNKNIRRAGARGAALALALFTQSAFADMTTPAWISQSTGPTPTNSWFVPLSLDLSGFGEFDSLAIRIDTGGEAFSHNALSDFSKDGSGWSVTGMNREKNISVAGGNQAEQMGLNVHFEGDIPEASGEVAIDVALFSEGSIVAAARGEWQDFGGSRFDRFVFIQGTWVPAIDELPTGMPVVPGPRAVLLGLVGLGITALVRYRAALVN